MLCVRYENSEIALNCGMMLRECVRHEPLCKIILYSEEFYNFFGFVEVSTFDIASDAFSTFKVWLLSVTGVNFTGGGCSAGFANKTQNLSGTVLGAKL